MQHQGQVALVEVLMEMIDPGNLGQGSLQLEDRYLVALLQPQLGEVLTSLSGDVPDQSSVLAIVAAEVIDYSQRLADTANLSLR